MQIPAAFVYEKETHFFIFLHLLMHRNRFLGSSF